MRCVPFSLLGLIVWTGCSSGFDAKRQADILGRVPPDQRQSGGPTQRTAEPFAVAAIAYNVDAFTSETKVKLPLDATMEVKNVIAQLSAGKVVMERFERHPAEVTVRAGFVRFDSEIAPAFANLKLPPSTALFFTRTEREEGGPVFTSVLVRTPPILTTRDIAKAETIQSPHTWNKRTELFTAVRVTLTDTAAEKYALWRGAHPGDPLAAIVFGHVTDDWRVPAPTGDEEARLPTAAEVRTFVVEINGFGPEGSRPEAEDFVKAVHRGS